MEEIATLIVATLQGQMMLLTHTHASTLTLISSSQNHKRMIILT
ncbi:unnamed protein product [Brassica rapa]|uniref:Uncharacterized protein n=2 Tax=Brassica TaxID=3705 RepID=A0A3P5Y4J2_BRACM|nr:unnamed protein product [Brassica napus]CAG7865267.1 unnamed protein product [Brassica rapa]VDC62357.1 unnamed protein product [Brassica rapa]